MKKTIKLSESELKRLIRKTIMEGIGEAKAIKVTGKNVPNNSYVIVDEPGDYDYGKHDECPFDIVKPEKESKKTTHVSEAQLKGIIMECVKNMMMLREDESEELGEPMAYSDVARLLSENGWSIFHSNDVHDRDYRCGVRFNIEPERNAIDVKQLESKLNALCDEFNNQENLLPGMGQYSVSMSSGYYKYAPEQKFVSIVIWNLE